MWNYIASYNILSVFKFYANFKNKFCISQSFTESKLKKSATCDFLWLKFSRLLFISSFVQVNN